MLSNICTSHRYKRLCHVSSCLWIYTWLFFSITWGMVRYICHSNNPNLLRFISVMMLFLRLRYLNITNILITEMSFSSHRDEWYIKKNKYIFLKEYYINTITSIFAISKGLLTCSSRVYFSTVTKSVKDKNIVSKH